MRSFAHYIGLGQHKTTKLDNRKARYPCIESEDIMALNTKKIRRPIRINGEQVWITADSEQEYAEKLMRLSGTSQRTYRKHLFKEYAERWYTIFSKPNIEHTTQLTYERQLNNYIYPILGDKFIEDITVDDVQRVFNQKEDTKKETKNKIKIVLNQIFNKAIDEELIYRNPLRSSVIKITGAPSVQTEPYSVEQMKFLYLHLNDIPNEFDKAWLALSISLPLRPEEVLGLRWMDIDGRIVHVRATITHPTRNQPEFKEYTKTESSRRALVIPEEILNYLPERGLPTDFVIGGGSAVTYTGLRWIRKRIEKHTGFSEPILPRRFRTTVATDISAQTHDLKLVQRMLGHSTPQMTLKHYDKGRQTATDASEAIGKCYGFADH